MSTNIFVLAFVKFCLMLAFYIAIIYWFIVIILIENQIWMNASLLFYGRVKKSLTLQKIPDKSYEFQWGSRVANSQMLTENCLELWAGFFSSSFWDEWKKIVDKIGRCGRKSHLSFPFAFQGSYLSNFKFSLVRKRAAFFFPCFNWYPSVFSSSMAPEGHSSVCVCVVGSAAGIVKGFMCSPSKGSFQRVSFQCVRWYVCAQNSVNGRWKVMKSAPDKTIGDDREAGYF